MNIDTKICIFAGFLIFSSSAAASFVATVDSGSETLDDSVLMEDYILELDDGFNVSELEAMGVEVEYRYDVVDAVAVEAPEGVLDDLEGLSFVDGVREDREVFLPDPDIDIELGDGEEENDSREEEAESTSSEGDGVSIAVLDTGVAYDHQDFDDVEFNVDFTGGDDPYDYEGHGTHVASIALGNGEHPGVAPEAGLQNIKVLGDDGSGRMSDVVAGIDYAVENDAEVIILSLGADVDSCNGRDMASRAVNNAVSEGVAVTVAAGNSGPDLRTVNAPGCSRDGFTSGATNNQNDGIARFSSRGETSDGRVKPDIVAPGTRILAADAETVDGYKRLSGTSMATPYVGGVLALMMQEEPGLEPGEYFEAIETTANDLGESENAQGKGMIDIEASIQQIQPQQEQGQSENQEEDQEQQEEQSIGDSENVENQTSTNPDNQTEVETPEAVKDARSKFRAVLDRLLALLNF